MNAHKASLLVLLVTLGWGSSYLFMKMGLGSIEEFNLIALRFSIAFLAAGIIFYRHRRNIDKMAIGYGALLGAILFGVCATILFGLKTTSTSNAGFLVGLTVIFVPLLSVIMYRRRPDKSTLFGVISALIGIGLLTLKSELRMYPGDILCIAGGILNALYILVSGAAVKKTDSITVGVLTMGFTAVYGTIFSFIFENPVLPGTLDGWLAILALSMICSVFCFIAQSVSLKYIAPVQLGIMYTLEPIFSAMFAFVFAGERLTMQGYIGAILVVAGILFSQLMKQKKQHDNHYAYTASSPGTAGLHPLIGDAKVEHG